MGHAYARPLGQSQAAERDKGAAGAHSSVHTRLRGLGNGHISRLVADSEAGAPCGCAHAYGPCQCQSLPGAPPSDAGEPLATPLRRALERGFGTDLSRVRLHAGPNADAEARRLDAAAFTSGQDIWLRQDRFAPEHPEGLRLLAHEVTHTVQRRDAADPDSVALHPGRRVSDPADPEEREADLVADRFVRGTLLPPVGPYSADGFGAPPTVLRSPAKEAIDRRTNWIGHLDKWMLGRDLLARARVGDFDLVQDTFDELLAISRDDVAYEFCAAASDMDLRSLAGSTGGRALIDRLFDELTAGSVAPEEQAQADRLLRVKSALIRPEDFAAGLTKAKIFPYRLPGLTVYDSAPISAERRPGGRIRVHLPTRVLDTPLFREETATLPADTFIRGIELPEDEIVGIRMYDLGGELVFRPALILVQLSNETTTTVLSKLAEIVGLGLTLGAGSLVGLGVEATMTARVLLWADRAALVLGTLTSVLKEHRGEIIARYGDPGREFLRYVDYVQSATAVYGFARVVLAIPKLVAGLRTAYGNWRAVRVRAAEEGAAGFEGELSRGTEELLGKADDIQKAKAGAPAPPPQPGPTTTQPVPGPAPMPRGFDAEGRLPRAGSRAVYHQGRAPTCGPVSCGMVLDTMGNPQDLSKLVRIAGPDGTSVPDVLRQLRSYKVNADARTGMTIADLERATSAQAGGNPALAVIRTKDPKHPLHYVVVDGVTSRLGERVVAVRNPWGIQYFELVDTFAKSFTGQGITINFSY